MTHAAPESGNGRLELDGIFLDMYGTVTGGDRAVVEATCAAIVADLRLTNGDVWRAAADGRMSPAPRPVLVNDGAAGCPPRAPEAARNQPDPSLPLDAREFAILWGERFFAAMNEANDDRFEPLYQLEARTLRQTLALFGRSIDPVPYIARLIEYWRDPPLQPDTRGFFERCPVPICIVSNVDRADLETALRRHDLRVAATVTSEETRSYKPHAGIFRAALERTGWRSDRVLHVGDSLHSDVGGAQAAGLRAAWVNRAHRIHDIGTAVADYEFADLLGLVRVALDGTWAAGAC